MHHTLQTYSAHGIWICSPTMACVACPFSGVSISALFDCYFPNSLFLSPFHLCHLQIHATLSAHNLLADREEREALQKAKAYTYSPEYNLDLLLEEPVEEALDIEKQCRDMMSLLTHLFLFM